MSKLDQMTTAVQAVSAIRRAMNFHDRGLEQDREDVTAAYERIRREARREDCRWGLPVQRIPAAHFQAVPTDYVSLSETPVALRRVA